MLSRLLVVQVLYLVFGVLFAGKNFLFFLHSLGIMVMPYQLRDLRLPK